MKPPKGWRWLIPNTEETGAGEIIRQGDIFLAHIYQGHTEIGDEVYHRHSYIRRITKKRKPTKRKGRLVIGNVGKLKKGERYKI